jgi:hypothetical protein
MIKKRANALVIALSFCAGPRFWMVMVALTQLRSLSAKSRSSQGGAHVWTRTLRHTQDRE